MKIHPQEWLLPEFPRIPHLYPSDAVQGDDLVASSENEQQLYSEAVVYIEEKLDGANCGMAYTADQVGILRNRTHILSKNYVQKKRTPAKEQFLSAWNWLSDHKANFLELNKILGQEVGVYGEWCVAIHGVVYENLPSRFIAYGIYHPDKKGFMSGHIARELLAVCEFPVVRLLYEGNFPGREHVLGLASGQSAYSSHQREGVVIKGRSGLYKVICPGYAQNSRWDDKKMTKQPSWSK